MSKKPKIEYLPISSLRSFKRNPQYMTERQMTALSNSIKKDGFVSPALVRPIKNNEYEIISGHHRIMAAHRAGLKEVLCVIASLTDNQAKRLVVNLNTIHGEPTADQLAPFLLDVKDISGIFLSDDLEKAVGDIENTIAKHIKEMKVKINKPSKQVPNCKCPICGQKHIKKK